MELTWSGIEKKEEWEKAGILLPGYDIKALVQKTKKKKRPGGYILESAIFSVFFWEE